MRAEAQREQLAAQRSKVDFDTYDIKVDELVRYVTRGRIEIAPANQRQFRWDNARQSRLIESLLLGIPIPPLFMATNFDTVEGSRWVVDGLQRLLTLVNYVSNDEARAAASLSGRDGLKLGGLEKLDTFDGHKLAQLPMGCTCRP